MSIVNERRPDGKAFVVSQFSYFLGDLVHNFVPDLFLALDFHHHQRPLRTDEEIDLASFVAFCRVLYVGGRRKHERLFEPEMRKQVVDVIEDKVLKLKAENGIPSIQLFKGSELEEPRLDCGRARFDVLQVESRIVVLDSVT